MDHRLPQLLGAGLALLGADRDCVSGPIVLDHAGVLDRDVGRPLLEILIDRIAPVVHHLLDEPVGLTDGSSRLIDKRALSRRPALGVALAVRRRQRPNLEIADALAAVGELALS